LCDYLSVACQQWTEQINTMYSTGGTINTAATVQLCQAACEANAVCTSVDFTANAPVNTQCKLHTASSSGKGTLAGTTNYVLDRSCQVPGNNFNVICTVTV